MLQLVASFEVLRRGGGGGKCCIWLLVLKSSEGGGVVQAHECMRREGRLQLVGCCKLISA